MSTTIEPVDEQEERLEHTAAPRGQSPDYRSVSVGSCHHDGFLDGADSRCVAPTPDA